MMLDNTLCFFIQHPAEHCIVYIMFMVLLDSCHMTRMQLILGHLNLILLDINDSNYIHGRVGPLYI